MGIKKYVANFKGSSQLDGSIPWYCRGFAGNGSLSQLENCPTPFGRRMVYAQGEPDTMFSIPAACEFRRRVIKGSFIIENGEYRFRVYRGDDSVFPYGA